MSEAVTKVSRLLKYDDVMMLSPLLSGRGVNLI